METDSDEKQLLNQILNAVKVTPSLHEDLQVEVMKVGLMWLPVCVIGTGTNSDSPHPNPPALIVFWEMPLHIGHASSPFAWNIWLLSLLMVPQSNLDY